MSSGIKQSNFLEQSVPEQTETSCPLSFAQEGLWFLHKLESGSSAYNICRLVTLKGELNVEALSWSLNRIIERHETLRTSFATREEEPCQIISSQAPLPLVVEDFAHVAHGERGGAAVKLAQAEAEQSFDLRQAPLLRARLLRLAADEHVLVLCVHHIVCDGWSVEILFSELEQFYNSACTGAPAQVAELPIQYADYALWQHDWLQGEVLDEQLAYWRDQLSGAEVLELPIEWARPAVQSYRGGVARQQLSVELSRTVQQLAQQQGATLFMVLLAAFQTLLWRYTGQKGIVVGTPVANRQLLELEGLIGFLVNMLALRCRISGDESFVELLAQVKETCLTGYAHQAMPFEKLVQELQPERSLTHSPLFQVILTMQSAARREFNLHQLETEIEVIHNAASKRDLSLYVDHEPAAGLKLWLEYNAELFDSATSENILVHYENLLEQIVSNPQQPLSELTFLTAAEKQTLLFDWSQTKTVYPRNSAIAELFEEQAERHAESIALRFGDEQLTYRELNQWANQLAHHLRAQGVGLEDKVALVLERSFALLVSMLAVLKAGGAYVPLDPNFSPERLSLIIDDAGAKVVVTESVFRERVGSNAARLVLLDEEREQIAQCEARDLEHVAEANNLAYVIYTSGSTARPKGVAVTNRGIVRLVKNTNWVELGRDEVMLLLTSITFDVSMFEIWGSLLNGATLALMPPGPYTMRELGEVLKRYEVTTLWLTAGVFQQMVSENVADLLSLRQLVAGGDAVSPLHAEIFLAKAVHSQLINGYGPTENTVFTCAHAMTGPISFASSVPIGRPIANSSAYVLDSKMQLVPRGVWGELYTGGDGVARGYINRPETTATSFVPDQFSAEPGARLYRTGDLARHLPNGLIEFGGRIDKQVKVRGYHIKLGEIETTLLRLPEVRQAVVIVREETGDKRLVGYVALHAGLRVKGRELQTRLREKLPGYMVPSIVVLHKLPLTPDGKVDRQALPALSQANDRVFVAPRSQTEQELAKIWSELLRIETIGVHDNFFDRGGHSLLVAQLVSRILNTFAVELKLQDIFNEPTVEAIAALIDSTLIEMSGFVSLETV